MTASGEDHLQVTKASEDQDYPENDYIQTMGLRWSPDGRRLLYFSNRLGNLDLKTVDVATGTVEVVEDRDGSHHPVGWLDDSTVTYVYESYRVPPDLHVKRLGETARRLTVFAARRVQSGTFRPPRIGDVDRAPTASRYMVTYAVRPV